MDILTGLIQLMKMNREYKMRKGIPLGFKGPALHSHADGDVHFEGHQKFNPKTAHTGPSEFHQHETPNVSVRKGKGPGSGRKQRSKSDPIYATYPTHGTPAAQGAWAVRTFGKAEPKLGTGTRFKNLVEALKRKSADEIEMVIEKYEVRDPKALAAWIMRRKYGNQRAAELSAAGKKK